MGMTNRERLRRFYAQFSGEDHVLIPIIADPDAIASAMAVKRLLWRKVGLVTIANVNTIERTDNLVLIRLIGIAMTPFPKIDPKRFTRIILVDAQPDHNEAFLNLKPDAIIDHHPVNAPNQAPFSDIRPRYGATSSIMVEYLRAANIKPSTKLATALYIAIKSDTSDFERNTQVEDLQAFQFVFRLSNIALARRIESAEIRRGFLKYFKKALDDVHIRKGWAIVHLGAVSNPDVCVQIADFLMHIDTVNWSIVSGLHQRKLVIILRNDGIRKDAGKLAKQSFGRWGAAGGHKSAARAELPLESLEQETSPEDQRKLSRWMLQRLTNDDGTVKRANPEQSKNKADARLTSQSEKKA